MSIEQPSGLGWLPDGSLLAVSMTGHSVWRRSTGRRGDACTPTSRSSRAARRTTWSSTQAARAYVGHYGFDLMAGEPPVAATLIRVDPDGSVTRRRRRAALPERLDDHARRAHADRERRRSPRASPRSRSRDDGSLSDHRIWGQIAPSPEMTTLEDLLPRVEFAPDGCTLDAEGCIWAADSLHKRCARIAPGGEILEEIESPGDLVFYGPMLGGEDGRTLLLCAAPDWREERPEGELAVGALHRRGRRPARGPAVGARSLRDGVGGPAEDQLGDHAVAARATAGSGRTSATSSTRIIVVGRDLALHVVGERACRRRPGRGRRT